MPNWCFNSVLITGKPDTIIKVKEQLNQPYTRLFKDSFNMETKQYQDETIVYSNPVFSFWNIIRPIDLETYYLQKDPKNDNTTMNFNGDNWYDWNVRNWGTKWDVAIRDNEEYPETELIEETEDSLCYRINTAWSPPVPAINKLSEQYPDLTINLEYEEEQGWGGEYQFDKGFITEVNSYSQKCNNCDNTTEDEFPICDDCDSSVCSSCNYALYKGEECEHKILV